MSAWPALTLSRTYMRTLLLLLLPSVSTCLGWANIQVALLWTRVARFEASHSFVRQHQALLITSYGVP
jgi:hypothetical protein